MQNIKVVQVGWNWINESGGAAQSIANFQKALGSFVVSFTRENGGSYRSSENVNQLHIPYKENLVNRYSYTNSPLKKQAEEILVNADLILCHGFYRYHFDWAVSIAKKHNIPYWVIPHGSLDPYVFTYRSFSKKLWFILKGNKSFSNASAFIFSTRSEMEKAKIEISSKIKHIIHWPVDFVNTESKEMIKLKIRSQLNIPIDAKVLIYIGRIHPIKRPIETIQAMAACSMDNLYLIIIGPDSEELNVSVCENFCSENMISNVRFIKPLYGQKKFDYFMASDAFISLSYKENFGYTVAEALSTGLPVILSPGIDLGRELKELGCAWILPDDRLVSAISAIKSFCLSSPELLTEMGTRGQVWARSELSRESFKSKIQALALTTVQNIKQTY